MYLSKVKVREAMQSKGIKTFTELAEAIGITKNQLSVMLSDAYNPFKTRVENLCEVLSVQPDEIMDFGENTSADSIEIEEDDITAIELFAGAAWLGASWHKNLRVC